MDGVRGGGSDIMSFSATHTQTPCSGRTTYHEIPAFTRFALKNSRIQARNRTRCQHVAISLLGGCERDAGALFARADARLLSLESPAESELHTHDAVGIPNAQERDVFSNGIFELNDLVL